MGLDKSVEDKGTTELGDERTLFQERLKNIEELAIYVHCSAHNLNLVINDAVEKITDVANYFAILQSLHVFFGQSINRWAALLSLTGESDVTLKKLNPTR